LQNSTDLIAAVESESGLGDGLLANDPNEVGNAVSDLNDVVGDVQSFVADNKDTLGTTSDKLRRWTTALNQASATSNRHCTSPRARSRTSEHLSAAQGALTGALALNNIANPISFLSGR